MLFFMGIMAAGWFLLMQRFALLMVVILWLSTSGLWWVLARDVGSKVGIFKSSYMIAQAVILVGFYVYLKMRGNRYTKLYFPSWKLTLAYLTLSSVVYYSLRFVLLS